MEANALMASPAVSRCAAVPVTLLVGDRAQHVDGRVPTLVIGDGFDPPDRCRARPRARGEPEVAVDVRHREFADRKRDLRRSVIELPCRGANARAEGGRHKQNDEERATRSGGAHGWQLNWAHVFSAGSIGGAVVRTTSPGALMTAWGRVTQPIAPRSAHSAVAIATRVAAFGNSVPWFISDLPSFVGARHRAVRSLHLPIHRRTGDGRDSRWIGAVQSAPACAAVAAESARSAR